MELTGVLQYARWCAAAAGYSYTNEAQSREALHFLDCLDGPNGFVYRTGTAQTLINPDTVGHVAPFATQLHHRALTTSQGNIPVAYTCGSLASSLCRPLIGDCFYCSCRRTGSRCYLIVPYALRRGRKPVTSQTSLPVFPNPSCTVRAERCTLLLTITLPINLMLHGITICDFSLARISL